MWLVQASGWPKCLGAERGTSCRSIFDGFVHGRQFLVGFAEYVVSAVVLVASLAALAALGQ
jgi:hypothetical protein